MDRVLQVIRERRSVRRYTTTAVDDATVDEAALCSANPSLPRRTRLSQEDAVLALEEVLLVADASAVGPTVLEILDPVLATIEHHAIVERRFVVDALLDVRLALEH